MPLRGNGHRRFTRPDKDLRQLTTLVQFGREAETAPGEEALLISALTTVAGVLPGNGIALALEDDGDIRIPERFVRGRIPVELATLVAAVSLDRGKLVEREQDGSTVVALPLAGSRGPIGALVTRSPQPGLADGDRQMLQAMARQLALAIDNHRLRRQLDHLLFRASPE